MTTVKDIADEIVALQSRKNSDYGNAFGISMQEFGLTAPAIRLTDKLNRFKSLIKKDAEVKDESIEDTLIDLASYAMMTVAEMRNGKDAHPVKGPVIIDVEDDDIHVGDNVRVIWSQYLQSGMIGKVQNIYRRPAGVTASVSFLNGELGSFCIEALAKIKPDDESNGKKEESDISKTLKRRVPNFAKELDYDGRVSSGVVIPDFIQKVLEDFRIGEVISDGNGEKYEVLDLEFIPKISVKRLKDGSQIWMLLTPKDDETR